MCVYLVLVQVALSVLVLFWRHRAYVGLARRLNIKISRFRPLRLCSVVVLGIVLVRLLWKSLGCCLTPAERLRRVLIMFCTDILILLIIMFFNIILYYIILYVMLYLCSLARRGCGTP